jgi:hypothetical protein
MPRAWITSSRTSTRSRFPAEAIHIPKQPSRDKPLWSLHRQRVARFSWGSTSVSAKVQYRTRVQGFRFARNHPDALSEQLSEPSRLLFRPERPLAVHDQFLQVGTDPDSQVALRGLNCRPIACAWSQSWPKGQTGMHRCRTRDVPASCSRTLADQQTGTSDS